MSICITPDDAARTQPTSEVEGGSMHHLLGDQHLAAGPLAFIASQTQVCVLPTHFHAADQFQVFITGEGKIGGHKAALGTIHYSDAYTPYGPVTPGPNGLSYLTLRPRYNYAYHTLPECKDLLKQKMQEHRGGQHIVETDLGKIHSAGTKLLWSRPDGVAIARIDMAPDESVSLPVSGSGRFCLVMRGDIEFAARHCAEGTFIWVEPGESASAMTATSAGALVIVLSFAPQH